MSDRLPGPVGRYDVCTIDDGTNARAQSPSPGPIGHFESVERLSIEDRFTKVLYLTAPKLPGEIQDEFVEVLTPANIAITVGVLAAWAASHYFGVGFIVDLILIVGGVLLLGWQVLSAAGDLYDCIKITWSAKTMQDLDSAANHLANFIAVVGVTVFMAIIAKGAKGKGSKSGRPANRPSNRATSAVDGLKLRAELSLKDGGILTDGGRLTPQAVRNSKKINLSDGAINNPSVKKVLTKDGSNINDWEKFTTQSVPGPNGSSLQVHFYKNKATGKIDYDTPDFKIKTEIPAIPKSSLSEPKVPPGH